LDELAGSPTSHVIADIAVIGKTKTYHGDAEARRKQEPRE